MQVHRDTPAVIGHGDGIAALVQRDRDRVGITVEVFIHGIVNNFPHEVVQSLAVHAADVHRRPFANRLKTFEDSNIFRSIGSRGTHDSFGLKSSAEERTAFIPSMGFGCVCAFTGGAAREASSRPPTRRWRTLSPGSEPYPIGGQ